MNLTPLEVLLFSQRVVDDLVLQHRLGQQLLQPRVLCPQFPQTLGLGHAHPAELVPPLLVRGLAEPVQPAQVFHRQACSSLTQEADDLFFGKPLLHVQSPLVGELDSRSGRYSKSGDVVFVFTG